MTVLLSFDGTIFLLSLVSLWWRGGSVVLCFFQQVMDAVHEFILTDLHCRG